MFATRFERRGAYFIPTGVRLDSLGGELRTTTAARIDDPTPAPGYALFVHCATPGEHPRRDRVTSPDTGRRHPMPTGRAVTISRHAALARRSPRTPPTTSNTANAQRCSKSRLDARPRLGRSAAVCRDRGRSFSTGGVQPARAAPAAHTVAAPLFVRRPGVNPGTTIEALGPLFTEEFEVAGCYLLPGEVAAARLGIEEGPRSELNGHGPHAWARHWLLVPLVDGERWTGLIWVDDPRDRLLPTRARLQALRLFANQALRPGALEGRL